MFPWSKDAEERNRKNVILLAKHLKTLKRKSSSSKTSSSKTSSSTRSSSKSSRSSRRSSSKSRRSSKRYKKLTRKLEARLDEQAKLLAALPRNSAVKRMIQDELKVKTQAEGEMLAKMTAMADSLKAQKDATELQISTLKAEIKMKKEQGEDTAKETKELQQVMVEQVKTDATIARIEKYGGVLANGLNASGTMLANVGTAVKGATYGLGDLTKSLGTNALGAAYGVGNITKSLGANVLGAAYGVGDVTKSLGTNALGAAYGLGNAASAGVYGLGNMARDVHKNKEVAGYFGDKAKLAAKIGALGAPAMVVGHVMDFNQTAAAVNTALNTDIAKTLQKMAKKAPSLKQEQAVVEEIIHTQRDQAAISKAVPSTKEAAVQIKVAAVEMKDQLKEDKAVADKPLTAPIDDKAYLKLLADFKMTDPIAKYVELWAGKKLRSKDIQEKIRAVGSKYMKHLKQEIQQFQKIIRDAPVHETREDEFEAVAADYVKPFKTTPDLKGMKLLFGHYVTLAKFAENLPYFSTPDPARAVQAAQVRDVNERAVSAEKAGDAALEAIARQSPPRVLNQAAADAAQAAVEAVEAGPEAVGAALQGMEAAVQAVEFAEQQALGRVQ